MIDKRTAEHGGVFERRDVDLRGRDKRAHHLQVRIGNEHRRRRRRNEIRPRVPLVKQRFRHDVVP